MNSILGSSQAVNFSGFTKAFLHCFTKIKQFTREGS